MASVEQTVEYFLRMYPEQFDSQGDVLAHLFFSSNANHQWQNGQLIPMDDVFFFEVPPDELREIFNQRIDVEYSQQLALEKELLAASKKKTANNQAARLLNELQSGVPQWQEQSDLDTKQAIKQIRILQHVKTGIANHAPLVLLPSNIADDWLDAAESVLDAYMDVRSNRRSNPDPEAILIQNLRATIHKLRH